jgi:hypothetical protein
MTRDDPPTVDRMRHDISRGKVGDKVDYPDPAAAPLGTDDEAAGTPPSAEARTIAAESAPSIPRERKTTNAGSIYAGIVVVIILIVTTAAMMLHD